MPTTESGQVRKWGVRFAVLAAVVGGYLTLRFTLLAPDPVPVRTVAVEVGAVEATITNSKAGTVKARRRSHLTAETSGRVVEIIHREGERVATGDVLVRLNDATVRAQLQLAIQGVRVGKAHQKQACLARDRAGRQLTRQRKLADQRIVSEDLLDELENAHATAEASCNAAVAENEQAQASLRVAEAQLEKTLILAPFDGVVAEVSTEVGEWVTPSPPLLTSPAVPHPRFSPPPQWSISSMPARST